MSANFILDTLTTISQQNTSKITHTFSNHGQPLVKVTAVPGSSGLQVTWLPIHTIKYFNDPESAAAEVAAYLSSSVSA